MRNEEVLHRVKGEGNILHEIKRREANWIGHIWRRSSIINHGTESKIDGEIQVT